jgi:uncharacterized Zn-finger protein
MDLPMTDASETIETETTTVSCDGGVSKSALGRPIDLGHPAVYLNMGDAREVTCPYCSRQFKLKEGVTVSAGGH